MNLTKVEAHLVALGLNSSAAVGEISNSGAALFRSLHKRNVTPSEFSDNSHYPHFLLAKLRETITGLEHTVESQSAQIRKLEAKSPPDNKHIKCLEDQLKFLQDVLVATPFGGCPTCKKNPQKTWRDKFHEAFGI